MDIKRIRKIIGWCAVINYMLLFLAVILFLVAHDWIYEFNQLFFEVSEETYNMVLLIALAFWEVLIWVFNIVPYIVLRIAVKD